MADTMMEIGEIPSVKEEPEMSISKIDLNAKGDIQERLWSDIVLPSFVEGEETEKIGKSVACHLNAFKIDVTKAPESVFKHELRFIVRKTKKNGEVLEIELHTRGQRNDVLLQARRRTLQKLLVLFFKRHLDVFCSPELKAKREKDPDPRGALPLDYISKPFAFDVGCALYLDFGVEALSGSIPQAEFPRELLDLLGGGSYTEVEYHLTGPHEVIKLAEKGRSAMQFLDVLTWQRLSSSMHYHYGNKAYYELNEKITEIPKNYLTQAKVYIPGVQKNVRVINNYLSMQVDAKVSPFWVHAPLNMAIGMYVQGSDRGNMRGEWYEGRMRDVVSKQLKGVIVRTTHLKKQRIFAIAGLSGRNADETQFQLKDGTTTSVTAYFHNVYKLDLKKREWPLVIDRKPGAGDNHYPIEVLEVVQGQRVNNSKATPDMIEQLIKQAQKKPHDLITAINGQLKYLKLDYQNDLLKRFKVSVEKEQIPVKANLLYRPQIRVGSGGPSPNFKFPEKWEHARFHQAAVLDGADAIAGICFDGIRDNYFRDAVGALMRGGTDRGMKFGNNDPRRMKVYELDVNEFERIADAVDEMKSKGVVLCLFVTRNKRPDIHNTMKLWEQRTSIIFQHFSQETMGKLSNTQMRRNVCVENVLLKMNLKLAGINFSLAPPKELPPDMSQKANATWFKKRMFIGLSITHGPPLSLAERQSGVEPADPSVVGFVYTVREPTDFRGKCWLQTPRIVYISRLEEATMVALSDYKKVNGELPESITIYRAGLSEGDYQKSAYEVSQIAAACAGHTKKYFPTVSCIFVQTGSNYRMFKDLNVSRDGRTSCNNVDPGTCLTSDGCNKEYKEFVMVAQRAIQGTARPIKCTVVSEVKGTTGKLLTLDEYKSITHGMCYGHGIVGAPISLPSVIQNANAVAKRGRENYKEAEDSNPQAYGIRMDVPREQADAYWKSVSDKLKTRLNCNYWA